MSESSPPIAVIAAMPEEVAPLLRRCHSRERLRLGGYRFHRGRLGQSAVLIGSCGEGKRNAEEGAAALLRLAPEAPLLGLGVAGALSPDLVVGDLVVAERVLEGGWQATPDAAWLERAMGLAAGRSGTVATVDELLASAAGKRALWERLDRPEVAVVDMESSRFAAAALSARRPFLILRAVSDAAGEELPPFLERCRDDRGGVDRRRAAAQALRHPGSIRFLLELRRRTRRCAEQLAEVTTRLLAAEMVCVG